RSTGAASPPSISFLDADTENGRTHVSDAHTCRSRRLARSTPSTCEDADPPGCEKSGRTGAAAARQALLHAPSVVRPDAQAAATRHAKRALCLPQASPPVCSHVNSARSTPTSRAGDEVWRMRQSGVDVLLPLTIASTRRFAGRRNQQANADCYHAETSQSAEHYFCCSSQALWSGSPN